MVLVARGVFERHTRQVHSLYLSQLILVLSWGSDANYAGCGLCPFKGASNRKTVTNVTSFRYLPLFPFLRLVYSLRPSQKLDKLLCVCVLHHSVVSSSETMGL